MKIEKLKNMGKYKLNGMGERTKRIESTLDRMEAGQKKNSLAIAVLETKIEDLKGHWKK